jgi:cardiolipin-specific phospholipase
VLSFVPYLQSPPTQTQTGREVRKEQSDGSVTTESAHDLTKTPSQSATSTNDPYGPRQWQSNLVKLSGKNRALNEFSVERPGEATEHNLVVIHGYGAGLGFFYKNFEALSRPKGWKLYAIDLLGMGRSSRPTFRVRAKDRDAAVREAEDWFVDSIEEWRRARNIDRFTLLGHSLGGYMAVAYALKYPGHLNKLILASPVGIPEDPYAMAAEMPEPIDAELQDSADSSANSGASTPQARPAKDDNNNFLNQSDKRAEAAKAAQSESGQPPRRRPLSKWITYLWDANISPFSLVRWSGPLGPRFVSGWTTRRFAHLPTEEAQALHTYAYTLFKQKGSGEYSLAYILAPGAFARSPLIRRIAGVGRQWIPATPAPIVPSEASCWPWTSSATAAASRSNSVASGAGGVNTGSAAAAATATPSANGTTATTTNPPGTRETGFPVVFFYGENDWMDVAGGFDAADKIKAATTEAKTEAKSKAGVEGTSNEDSGLARVHVVKKAGHHVYLDGWEEFNALMLKEMGEVEEMEARRTIR